MLRSITRFCCLFLLLCVFLLPSMALAHTTGMARQKNASNTLPAVDPSYVYNQLFYMGTHFLRREAGYDNNLPPTINGHDEFAAYWSQEMMKNLQGFGAQMRRDTFAVQGWVGRPTTVPAVNVEISVPGVTHPEQVVVIGCHYDGEAVSTQSAFDDASGCAIELGVAKAMGAYWQSQHVYPARTLRFVIFDAEEQGLYGSFHYVNNTVNGDLSNIVTMFNEEQNGIAYPLRYLGALSNPLLPFYVEMAPLQNNSLYSTQSQLSVQRRDAIASFRSLMQTAIGNVFAQFRALGYQNLTYHSNGNTQNVAQPIFTPGQLSSVHVEDDPGLGSDQIPFTMAGVPCVTFAGDGTHDDKGSIMPPYPFDTSADTIQLMNTYADGSSRESQALALALALPGMLTTWMLVQPTILGQTTADANPIASISDIGQTQVGKSITLDANTSFDPGNPNNTLTYDWDFGDGASASGVAVEHTYKNVGNYTLTLTVASPGGKRIISKTINVTAQTPDYANPFVGFRPTGNTYIPQGMPTPDDRLTDKVSPGPQSATTSPTKKATPLALGSTPGIDSTVGPLIASIGVTVVLLVLLLLVVGRRRKPAG
ncbi:MAG: M28 family peptidase [Ktedonobacteraceae bacterium]